MRHVGTADQRYALRRALNDPAASEQQHIRYNQVMRIASIKTRAGDTVRLGKLTVLVGPNNVGKSQTLRDVHDLAMGGASAPTTLVTSVAFEKPAAFDELLVGIEQRPSPSSTDNVVVRGIGASLRGAENFQVNLDSLKEQFARSPDLTYLLGNLARLHVSYLDASSRLQVAQQSPSHNQYDTAPGSLLQALFTGKGTAESKLRDAFKRTFGLDIRLDYGGMQQLMLRVAKEFVEIPVDPRDQVEVMQRYAPLDKQGDGFRSFVGVVLSVLLTEGRAILLDEPEAFLHPMQARRLGLWLAEQVALGSSQVIVATHNANFLAGVLAANQQVDIYRLNRNDDETSYNLIAADDVKKLSRSPILSSQRVLEAIFHRGVVVCEADADRAVYEAVAVRDHDNRDVLFVHAHNKQTIKTVVGLLRKATIPVCAVADIDILNSETDLKALVLALTPDYDLADALEKRNVVGKAVDGRTEAGLLTKLELQVKELGQQLAEKKHSLSGARGALARIEKESSKWSQVKQKGSEAVPEAVRDDAKALMTMLKNAGLFVVPVGELEAWMNLGISQKNKWIIPALEAIGNGESSNELRLFVKDALEYLNN